MDFPMSARRSLFPRIFIQAARCQLLLAKIAKQIGTSEPSLPDSFYFLLPVAHLKHHFFVGGNTAKGKQRKAELHVSRRSWAAWIATSKFPSRNSSKNSSLKVQRVKHCQASVTNDSVPVFGRPRKNLYPNLNKRMESSNLAAAPQREHSFAIK